MLYVICTFAILAILISLILIDMGISDSDKVTIGIGFFILAGVLAVGGCFYVGIKAPLVIASLIIGLPMCYNACKSMAYCSKENPYSTGDKIIGSVYWGFSMLFLIVAFYYWYYIPETRFLTIAMSLLSILAFAYAMYCLFTRRSNFLPGLTALVFASIVFYFGAIREILPLNQILYYPMLVIMITIGMKFLIRMVYGINLMHENRSGINQKDRKDLIQVLFSGNEFMIL